MLALQLVPAVTELVISELLWLNYANRDKPVYLYVNSVGSQTPDNEVSWSANSSVQYPASFALPPILLSSHQISQGYACMAIYHRLQHRQQLQRVARTLSVKGSAYRQ